MIVAVVVVVALVVAGAAYWKFGRSSSSSSSGPTALAAAKKLHAAWQSGDRTAAAKVATPAAVTTIFAVPSAQGRGLVFGGCKKVGSKPLPKRCVWTRPGGQLTMTIARVGGQRRVTTATLGPAGLAPTATS